MMQEKMQVVYEVKDDYDLSAGPCGYEKVGFRFEDQVVWMATWGYGMPNSAYAFYKQRCEFVKELVARWNVCVAEAADAA